MGSKFKNLLSALFFGIFIGELAFIITFYILLLITMHQPLNLAALFDIHWQYPAFFLIPAFLIFVFVIVYIFIHKSEVILHQIDERIRNMEEKEDLIYEFIEAIRQWNIDYEIDVKYQKEKIFQALYNLREEIKKSREEEERRKKEDRQRQWVSEGLAKFGAILRENVDNLQKLTEEVTRHLTKYVDAKQAAFFLIKEEEGKKYLEMTAFFAYDRKKFPDKRFEWGEGLIGAAAIEKKTIFLKDTSNDFVEITSGLGGANPRAILITPIKDSDDNVHGVLELASFKVFEDYEVNFIEQVAESIGSTIANIKINLRTQQLLKESQQQAERLAQQEEVMRRSIAELQELQKKSEQESQKFISFLESVNNTFIRAEFSLQGLVEYANEKFVKIFNFVNEHEALNVHYSTLLNVQNIDWFNEIWDNIIETGKPFVSELQFITRDDKFLWLSAAFSPIKNKEGKVTSILFLALDRTETKLELIEFQEIFDTFNKVFLKMEFLPDGKILNFNKNLLNLLGIKPEDISEKYIFDFIKFENEEEFKISLLTLTSGKVLPKRIKLDFGGKSYFLEFFFAPVFRIYDQAIKFIGIGYDVSKIVELNKKIEELSKNLEITENRLKEFQQQFQKQLDLKTQDLKQQNQKLEQLNQLITKVLDLTGNAVLVINQDGRIIYVNDLVEQLWNVKRNVILGRRLSFLFPDLEELLKDEKYLFNLISKKAFDKQLETFIVDKEIKKHFGQAILKQLDENLVVFFKPKQ